jgi:hypothetical protein
MNFNTPKKQVIDYLNNIKNKLKLNEQIIVDNENFIFAIGSEIADKIVDEKKQDLFRPLNDLGREYFLYKTNQCSSKICCEILLCDYCCNCCCLCKLTISSQFSENAKQYSSTINSSIEEHWKDLILWDRINILRMLGCTIENIISVTRPGYDISTDRFGALVLEVFRVKSNYDKVKNIVFNCLTYHMKLFDAPPQIVMDEI